MVKGYLNEYGEAVIEVDGEVYDISEDGIPVVYNDIVNNKCYIVFPSNYDGLLPSDYIGKLIELKVVD
jgi:hypothetical protein